jgi:hypothetical protein
MPGAWRAPLGSRDERRTDTRPSDVRIDPIPPPVAGCSGIPDGFAQGMPNDL